LRWTNRYQARRGGCCLLLRSDGACLRRRASALRTRWPTRCAREDRCLRTPFVLSPPYAAQGELLNPTRCQIGFFVLGFWLRWTTRQKRTAVLTCQVSWADISERKAVPCLDDHVSVCDAMLAAKRAALSQHSSRSTTTKALMATGSGSLTHGVLHAAAPRSTTCCTAGRARFARHGVPSRGLSLSSRSWASSAIASCWTTCWTAHPPRTPVL
jgi:hypothetical protein